MASSLSTKLRIAYNVALAPGFFDAIAGRFTVVPNRGYSGEGLPDPQPIPQTDLRGALHIHTTYSDGLSDVPTVMQAATESGVDFVLICDHNTMKPLQDAWQETYAEQTPFVLVGTEVTVKDGRFLLALDVPPDYKPEIGVTAQVGIDMIRARNGFPLISLPFDMKHPYEDWAVSGYEGLEVLNFSTIARRHINFLSLPWILFVRKRGGMQAVLQLMASRPDAALARWDLLTRGGARRVVGIGALDAHAQMKMFGKKYPIPTYADSFRACQTHVMIPGDITGAGRIPAVNSALRSGHCYFSYDCLADPTGFRFFATNIKTGSTAVMGDSLMIRDNDPVCFSVTVPGENVFLRLFRDGKIVASSINGRLTAELSSVAGAYRVEASLYQGHISSFYWGVRPWIFSNPIYLKKIDVLDL